MSGSLRCMKVLKYRGQRIVPQVTHRRHLERLQSQRNSDTSATKNCIDGDVDSKPAFRSVHKVRYVDRTLSRVRHLYTSQIHSAAIGKLQFRLSLSFGMFLVANGQYKLFLRCGLGAVHTVMSSFVTLLDGTTSTRIFAFSSSIIPFILLLILYFDLHRV